MKYLGGESNPYLTFRKRLFYPLNYQGFSPERPKAGQRGKRLQS